MGRERLVAGGYERLRVGYNVHAQTDQIGKTGEEGTQSAVHDSLHQWPSEASEKKALRFTLDWSDVNEPLEPGNSVLERFAGLIPGAIVYK